MPLGKTRAPKKRYVQVESKNALIELLRDGADIEKVFIANNAFRDDKTREIISLAGERHIPLEKVNRKRMNRMAKTKSCESVIGLKPLGVQPKLSDVLTETANVEEPRLFLLLDHVQYAQNLGAILRTAFGAMVTAVVVPKKEGVLLTEEVTRISMGASERIPIIQMSTFDAIKQFQESGIRVIGVHMEGETYFTQNLKGDVVLVLGNEAEGISPKVIERCDALVRIPMQEGIESLNVGATAAIVMFEKRRQDLMK